MQTSRQSRARRTRIGWIILSAALMLGVMAAGSSIPSEAWATGSQGLVSLDADTTERPDVLGRLVFTRHAFFTTSSAREVLTSNPDGSGQTTLTQFANAAGPSWSPDGTKIIFTSMIGAGEINVVNANGTNGIKSTNTGSIEESNAVWSANGKIAYEREGGIWTMNTDGSDQALFSAITAPAPLSPAWSPDGSMLAFVSGSAMFVINSDGTDQRQVTNNAATPSFSPDGSKIVFSRGGIWVVDLDGTNETQLTSGFTDREPSWSSDNTRIAFVRNGSAANGIYVMDINGANQLLIIADNPNTPGRTIHDFPSWQPVAPVPNTFTINGRITRGGASLSGVTVDLAGTTTATATTDSFGNFRFDNLPAGGSFTVTPSLADHIFTPPRRIFAELASNQLADFTAGETCSTPNCRVNGKIVFVRNAEIYTANADGSNPINIANNSSVDHEPAWSPDGSRIVFQANRDGNSEIYTMKADGSDPVRLTTNSVFDTYPAYSPDGRKIVFVRNVGGNTDIYSINADGSDELRLTNDPEFETDPAWSPDGSKIAYSRAPGGIGRIYTMNADGSDQTAITPGGFDRTPSYSPDGTKIVFDRYCAACYSPIIVINTDGSNPVEIGSGFNPKPSFSPDGRRIIFASYNFSTQRYDIFTIPRAGGAAERLIENADRPDWQPLRPATRKTVFDYDADGRTDISVYRPSEGSWYVQRSAEGFVGMHWGVTDDKIVPADYDGDGRSDIAVFRPSDQRWYIANSSDGTYTTHIFGIAEDLPTPSDYDGDGTADLSVFRPSDGTWYRRNSSNGHFGAIQWGAAGDKPVIGDYDGDGKTDFTVFRPSNGYWYVYRSSDGQFHEFEFGLNGDIPLSGDFNGDGRSDLAVFRPSNGTWYIARPTGIPGQNYDAYPFGVSTDIPTPGDYDGDGRTDISVFRPSDGNWYRLNSGNGSFEAFHFGINGDRPTPSAYQ